MKTAGNISCCLVLLWATWGAHQPMGICLTTRCLTEYTGTAIDNYILSSPPQTFFIRNAQNTHLAKRDQVIDRLHYLQRADLFWEQYALYDNLSKCAEFENDFWIL